MVSSVLPAWAGRATAIAAVPMAARATFSFNDVIQFSDVVDERLFRRRGFPDQPGEEM
jgi:hypothetical protein